MNRREELKCANYLVRLSEYRLSSESADLFVRCSEQKQWESLLKLFRKLCLPSASCDSVLSAQASIFLRKTARAARILEAEPRTNARPSGLTTVLQNREAMLLDFGQSQYFPIVGKCCALSFRAPETGARFSIEFSCFLRVPAGNCTPVQRFCRYPDNFASANRDPSPRPSSLEQGRGSLCAQPIIKRS